MGTMEHNGDVEKAILAEMSKPESALIERVTRHNQILLHNYKVSLEKTCGCQLIGCGQEFTITLIPNQVLYPKFCSEHRSEFRRLNFLRQCALAESGCRFESVRVLPVGEAASDC